MHLPSCSKLAWTEKIVAYFWHLCGLYWKQIIQIKENGSIYLTIWNYESLYRFAVDLTGKFMLDFDMAEIQFFFPAWTIKAIGLKMLKTGHVFRGWGVSLLWNEDCVHEGDVMPAAQLTQRIGFLAMFHYLCVLVSFQETTVPWVSWRREYSFQWKCCLHQQIVERCLYNFDRGRLIRLNPWTWQTDGDWFHFMLDLFAVPDVRRCP